MAPRTAAKKPPTTDPVDDADVDAPLADPDPGTAPLPDPEPDGDPDPEQPAEDDPAAADVDVAAPSEPEPRKPAVEPTRSNDSPGAHVDYYEFAEDLTVKAWTYTLKPTMWHVGAFGTDGKARFDFADLPYGYRHDIDSYTKDELIAKLQTFATP